MKQFNLEEYLKNPSRKVVTRDGRAVKILCTNFHGNQPVIAEIQDLGFSSSFTTDGRYFDQGGSMNDLFFTPEKHEGWVNVYRDLESGELYCGYVYDSEEEAKKRGGIATVKIEWEEQL